MNELTKTTITSMEAAEWCGKDHGKLLRDIRNCFRGAVFVNGTKMNQESVKFRK